MSARAADACFGVFFVGLAAAVVVYADAPIDMGVMALAALLALLGIDGVLAALTDRRSLLSRIGPLP